MISVIALSFVGTLVVGFVNANHQDDVYNAQRLERKERAIQQSLEYVIDGVKLSPDQSIFLAQLLNDRICELAEIHDLTISVYNTEGLKITSSSPEGTRYRVPPQILEGVLQSSLPGQGGESGDAGWDLDLGPVVEAYLRFDDLSGRPIGLVGLKYEKRQVEGADFLSFVWNLAPVYLLLFLMALVLAGFLTQTITRPIRQLTAGMEGLSPDGMNRKPLRYHGQDDIGKLVQAYNNVQGELSEKVVELSKRERESAWRLMAMQVAHEIKNPLTPLRLGLQQLLKAWRDEQHDFGDRLRRYDETATAQMEVLNTIATDFSLLAELNPKLGALDRVDFSQVIHDAVDLWSASHPDIQWDLSGVEPGLEIRGKVTHLIRAMNNLLSNAIHAMEGLDARSPLVCIGLQAFLSDQIRCTISDTGPGIPQSEQLRIFEPRFTTKSHGTGMGLAMVQAIVKQYGGSIRLLDKAGFGAEFEIIFPQA